MRVTPDNIDKLKENEIFVFGSNTEGRHGKGAAKLALDRFGAIYGKGVGIGGQSYAIPTKKYSKNIKKGWDLKTIPINEIVSYINDFINYTLIHKELNFLVTKIGCGLAGYTPENIAPLFIKAIRSDNIFLPQKFINVIERLK